MSVYFIDVRADGQGGVPVASAEDVMVRSDQNRTPQGTLLAELQSAVLGKDVLFGTHGFHVNRDNGMDDLTHWTKWLQLGPNGVFVGVLWPGDSRWVPYVDYPVEGDDAIQSGKLLARYLAANLMGAASWSFTSHSLGARVVLQAIESLQGNAKLKSVTLMAGAIDDSCLTGEYGDAAKSMKRVSVLASKEDDVLKLAFPAGNLVFGLIRPGEAFWHGAIGRYGPNPSDQPGALMGTPIVPDKWDFGHFSYINCGGLAVNPAGEAVPFPPAAAVIPSDPNAAKPAGALDANGKDISNWRQALSAEYVSLRTT